MKYMGSKRRIAKHILPIMLKEMQEKGYTNWVEPFVGGGNVIDKVPAEYNRFGYDLNPHAIFALRAIRDFAEELPESCTEEYYKQIKGSGAHPVTSWLRFVCSFGGRFDEGYAREKGSNSRTFASKGKRSAIKQQPNLKDVSLIWLDYKNLRVYDSLIYCDPPYQNTTKYKTGNFNHEEFFDWCRSMKAKGNSVFVSEYSAPEDFEEVWQGTIKTNFSSTRKEATRQAVEKLFKV